MNTKVIEKVIWKIWKPLKPEEFPCLFCGPEREATQKVTINGKQVMWLCDKCAHMGAGELIEKRKNWRKEITNHGNKDRNQR